MAVDAQLIGWWLALSKCVFDCLWPYNSQPGSPSCRLGWRRIVGWLQVPGSIASWPVWASQEPPVSTALLTHLGTALRALHSCRLLGFPAALTGIGCRSAQSFSHSCLSSPFISASTCLSSHVLDASSPDQPDLWSH